jgi:hypothetical protein
VLCCVVVLLCCVVFFHTHNLPPVLPLTPLCVYHRIVATERLGELFNQTQIPLRYTPRKCVVHPITNHLIVIEADHNAYSHKENLEIAEALKQLTAEQEDAAVCVVVLCLRLCLCISVSFLCVCILVVSLSCTHLISLSLSLSLSPTENERLQKPVRLQTVQRA